VIGYVDFILKQSRTRSQTVKRTDTKTFIVKPRSFVDKTEIDFGVVTIASSAKPIGNMGQINTIIKGNPTLTTEIIKVEML
jgi:hypothetical protein